MFEKEAKEYSIGQTYPRFQDNQIANFVLREVEGAYWKGANDVYHKYNEWHYVKDELPDYNGQFYVALKGQTETFILNYDYDDYDESKMVWLDDDDTNFDDEVYAWREKLKAPKESK